MLNDYAMVVDVYVLSFSVFKKINFKFQKLKSNIYFLLKMHPILATSFSAFFINVPLGYVRQKYTEKYTLPWIIVIHASVPAIIYIRKKLLAGPPRIVIPLNIAAAVLGQYLGGSVVSNKV